MNLHELAQRLGGAYDGPDLQFSGFTLDSREQQEQRVFLAIHGERADGHDFVSQVLGAGAVAAVVSRPTPGNVILVPNLAEALAQMGRSLRREFAGPVVGITGSNGKTTAKEMIASALTPLGPVLKSEGNQNTEWSSPLIWHRAQRDHRSAVIEMGMRGAGQIAHLASISEPTHAVITMIGTAHLELLGSRQKIAEVKSEILLNLSSSGCAFLYAEDDFLEYLSGRASAPVRTFGTGERADARVVHYQALDASRAAVGISVDGTRVDFELGMVGQHQALNASSALLVASTLGVPLDAAVGKLTEVRLPGMRMERREWRGATVLVDTYNASPDSMRVALQALFELPCSGQRIAVLGTMRELGDLCIESHRKVGEWAAGADLLLTLGDETEDLIKAAGHGTRAESMSHLRELFMQVEAGDLVLIKGSRALAMEQLLEEPT